MGVGELAIELMHAFISDESIAEQCCELLKNLAVDPTVAVHLVNLGALRAIRSVKVKAPEQATLAIEMLNKNAGGRQP